MDEDAELQRALEMSMNDDNGDGGDQEMMSTVLNSLPGVDANDERIKKALDDMKGKKKKDDGDDA
jgi:26S proteasome regulatory subunit N10